MYTPVIVERDGGRYVFGQVPWMTEAIWESFRQRGYIINPEALRVETRWGWFEFSPAVAAGAWANKAQLLRAIALYEQELEAGPLHTDPGLHERK